MSDPAAAGRLLDAERGAKLARDRLGETVTELQARLDPRRLANKAKHRATIVKRQAIDTGTVAADASVTKARDNPGAIIGAVAAVVVFLLRHRLAALVRRKPSQPPPDPATDPHAPR
jgi:hypothetical protein